ncbi:hypothetical protein D9757_002267 [Collybiopsis confluens]|uniref:Origin recognition complex subunit 2 n=1 Tax=Collybiopsis confluens TaxID=2823264 RepID=A0A8H5HZZ7_9AGAR|nr:hypothetical protein D9757_002267 [Collybiopsis confluens]
MSDSDISDSDVSQGFVSEDEAFPAPPLTASPSKNHEKHRAAAKNSDFIVQAAFDSYFTHMSTPAQTSTNIFSSLVPPLSAEEYVEASYAFGPPTIQSEILTSELARASLFRKFLLELQEGFNIICYGYGSKRKLLNEFALNSCSKVGHVVVANGFQLNFGLKELLACIEKVPGVSSLALASNSIESQSRRISDFFAQPSQKRHLYLIIHNLDSPSLRGAKAQLCLSVLALNPKIHVVASVDHINSTLSWSSAQLSARKSSEKDSTGSSGRGFAWLWHDLTTLAPYDFELSHADRSSISGASGGMRKRDAATQNGVSMVSETAALHVLASVTVKAKKLFALMAGKQLEAIEASTDTGDLQQYAIGYATLYGFARDDFIATNDTGFRALLGEFRDHDLIVGTQHGSTAEALWIPMRKERLTKVLSTLKAPE